MSEAGSQDTMGPPPGLDPLHAPLPSLPVRLIGSFRLARRMRGQARMPFRPIERIRQAQSRRVRAMIRHAYRSVPFYRETMDRLGLRPRDFRTAEDLAQLPTIGPSQLRSELERFVSSDHSLDRCVRLGSSGSTGESRSSARSR